MAPRVRSKFRSPMFEPKVFRQQMCCSEESTCDIVGIFRHPGNFAPLVTLWSHAAENRTSACWRPCPEDASSTKLSPKSKQLIRRPPKVTASSTRLWLPIQFIKAMKRSGDGTHSCRSPTPTVNNCDLTPLTRIRSSDREYSDLMASNRRPSKQYSRSTPQRFSRWIRSYTFSRSIKHV